MLNNLELDGGLLEQDQVDIMSYIQTEEYVKHNAWSMYNEELYAIIRIYIAM